MFKLSFILAILIFLIPAPAVSSPGTLISPDHYRCNTWTTRDGLPQNTVHCMVRDPEGYMWLGTGYGVVRFDGLHFETPGILKNVHNVTSLLVTGSGSLWIGTDGCGVVCYHYRDHGVENFNTKNGLASNFIRTMKEDSQGSIWLGTTDRGIIRVKDGVFTSFTTNRGLSHNHVTSLLADEQGDLWVGTENGLNCLTNGKFTVFTTGQGLPHHHVTALCRDKQGRLLVGTIKGMARLDRGTKKKTFKSLDFPTQMPGEKFGNKNKVSLYSNTEDFFIHDFLEDKNGVTWIAADGGIYRFVPSKSAPGGKEQVERFVLDDGFFRGPVISLYEDPGGILWLGTTGKGFGNLYISKFKFYTVDRGLSHHYATAVYQDRSGDVWIGTRGGGLNRFSSKTGTFKIYTRKHGLAGDWITSIYGDGEGNTWIGTGGGLNRFKNERFKTFTTADGLSGSFVRSVFVDRAGNVWIGTHGSGLNRYNPHDGKFTIYGIKHGLANLFVSLIREDARGDLWVGTDDGLYRFQDDRFHCFSTKEGLSGTRIFDIYADPDGVLWIASNGGLHRYKNGILTHCKNRGRPFNTGVYRILEDDSRYLWLTTANGVFGMLKGQLNRYDEDKKGIPDYYHFHGGMLNTAVFTGGYPPAGWKTLDGSLWLPTCKGITVIPPGEDKFNPDTHQPVHMEKITADGMPVDMEKSIHLPAGTKTIEVFFNAPNYISRDMLPYRCRLEGASYDVFGNLWVDRYDYWIPSDNRAVCKDLPAGRYILTIFAGSGRGAIEFYIRQSFFGTLWFFLVLLFTGLIAAAAILPLVRKRAKEREMLSLWTQWTRDDKYKTFRLSNRESKKYFKKLIELMEREKLYLDEDMSLARLAEKLDTGKEVLSQVINRELYLNFNAFLNRYRVEEAKKKLRDPKENQFVVLKIGHDVGFNSKSSFNAVFKKMTGMSPSQYREKYQEKQ